MSGRKFILSAFGINKPFEFLFPYIIDYGIISWLKDDEFIVPHLLEGNEKKIYLVGGEKHHAPELDPPAISVARQELIIDRESEGFFGAGDYLFPYPRSGRRIEGDLIVPSGIAEFPFPDDSYEGSGHLVNLEYRRGLYNIDYWTLVINPYSTIGLHYFLERIHQIFRNRADRYILQSVPHPEIHDTEIKLGYFPMVLILEGLQDLSEYEKEQTENRILRAQATIRVYAPCVVESIKDESKETRSITVGEIEEEEEEGEESEAARERRESISRTIERIFINEKV